MSIADIEMVKKAEKAAADARKKAEELAVQLVQEGKKEAKDLLEQANKDADKLYAAAIEKAEKKASKLYDQIIEKEASACEEVKTRGRARIGEVVDDIVGKVVSI